MIGDMSYVLCLYMLCYLQKLTYLTLQLSIGWTLYCTEWLLLLTLRVLELRWTSDIHMLCGQSIIMPHIIKNCESIIRNVFRTFPILEKHAKMVRFYLRSAYSRPAFLTQTIKTIMFARFTLFIKKARRLTTAFYLGFIMQTI